MITENEEGISYVLSDEFQRNSGSLARQWDKEWMRYFSSGKDYSFYFYDMDTSNYALAISPQKISNLGPAEFYDQTLYKEIKGRIWTGGRDLVGKDILEMGCGPGAFGKVAGRFVNSYTGIDASRFALYIADLTSPDNCHYIHLFDPSSIGSLGNKFDCSFGRHFFIHHNYSDSLWILKFLRDLTKSGGVILADFFSSPETIDGHRRIRCTDALVDEYPSALFDFSDEDIRSLSEDAGLDCVDISHVKDLERRFARFSVR